MKWIGQHIYDLVSRFRGDVYLENLSTTTGTDSLVIDSDGKISKNTSIGGDITSLGTLTRLEVDSISLDDKTITITGDTSDTLTIVTGAAGATTMTTTDAGGTAGYFEIAADGDIILDSARQIKLEPASGSDILLDGTISVDAGVITGATSITSTTFVGGLTGRADTVSTIAGLAPNTATTQATQAAITSCANLATVGTIGTGVWQGTAVASAYLDADTAHLSTSKQLTHHMMVDDIDTTKIYIPLQTPDTENATATNKQLPILAPVAGKLLKIFLRANTDLSGNTLTWRLETQNTSSVTAATPTIVGTQSGAGCTNRTMTTYDFTSSLDSGDNLIDAGDTAQISIQSSGTTANTRFHITLLWEWDLS